MSKRTEDEDDDVVRDGQTIRVSLMMMDSMDPVQCAVASNALVGDGVGHRPGSLALTDADRERRQQLHDAYERTLTSRWRNPLTPASQRNPERPTGDARLDAYAQYNQRVANAWRHR